MANRAVETGIGVGLCFRTCRDDDPDYFSFPDPAVDVRALCAAQRQPEPHAYDLYPGIYADVRNRSCERRGGQLRPADRYFGQRTFRGRAR